jgi:phenylpropionate dioxygenase-like ring-hydroxylating dioxygenase large terminal subunit
VGFFKRLFGICRTKPPADPNCWRYAEGRIELDLSRTPELAESGGAVRLESGEMPVPLLVVRSDEGSLHVFPNRCTHIGHRRLDPVPGKGVLKCCSVGQSEFDYEGRHVAGPAEGDIEPLNHELHDQKLIIPLG